MPSQGYYTICIGSDCQPGNVLTFPILAGRAPRRGLAGCLDGRAGGACHGAMPVFGGAATSGGAVCAGGRHLLADFGDKIPAAGDDEGRPGPGAWDAGRCPPGGQHGRRLSRATAHGPAASRGRRGRGGLHIGGSFALYNLHEIQLFWKLYPSKVNRLVYANYTSNICSM